MSGLREDTQAYKDIKDSVEGVKIDRVVIERYDSQPDYTHGRMIWEAVKICVTIEDEKRVKKIKGETRVPNGIYKLGLRDAGGFSNRYQKKFSVKGGKHFMGEDWHQGMLCVYNAGNWEIHLPTMKFQYILIHIGNDDDDTAGCLLTGTTASKGKNFIGGSTTAYKKIYPILRDAILASKDGYIEIEYKSVDK